jgi:nicotinamide mononucleotide transporter
VDAVALVRELSPVEAAGVLFSVLYLVLAIRENLWCWPAAFVSSVLTILVMFGARLYSEAALNVFYAAIAVYGWYQWRYGGRRSGARQLPIGVWPLRAHVLAIGGSVALAADVRARHFRGSP